MYKFSMLDCLGYAEEMEAGNDVENQLLSSLKANLMSDVNKFYGSQYVHGGCDPLILQACGAIKLSEFVEDFIPFLEIDIYNMINFTCDYLQNDIPFVCGEEDARSYFYDAVSYWSEHHDSNVNKDDKIDINKFIEDCDPLKYIIPELFVYCDNDNENIKDKVLMVSKVCPGFGLYVFKNIKDMFWYRNNMTENYTKFLLCNFLKAEQCSFADSDFYILEKLTNVNSAVVMANALYEHISSKNAKWLMEQDEITHFRNEIDLTIKAIAESTLTYSKAFILNILFEKAKKDFDFQGEFNLSLRFVRYQFFEIASSLERYVREVACTRFYKMLDNKKENVTLDDIGYIKRLNHEEFLKKNPYYRKDNVIKIEEAAFSFIGVTKTNCVPAWINVYIQKKFISYLNYLQEPFIDLSCSEAEPFINDMIPEPKDEFCFNVTFSKE